MFPTLVRTDAVCLPLASSWGTKNPRSLEAVLIPSVFLLVWMVPAHQLGMSQSWGQQVTASPPIGPTGSAPQPGLLLLRNGSVLEGQIRAVPGGFVVRVPRGEITVPQSQVDSVCLSLEEAYQYRRSRLPVGDAKAHLELAAWCLRYHLPTAAAHEIAAAEELSPQHPMIPLLKRRLALLEPSPDQWELDPSSQPSNPAVPTGAQPAQQASVQEAVVAPKGPPTRASAVEAAVFEFPLSHERPSPGRTQAPPRPASGNAAGSQEPAPPPAPMPASQQETLQTIPGASGSGLLRATQKRVRQQELERLVRSLPPGAVQRFTQSVQPIITHNCGTARCHGGEEAGEFRWLRSPSGMPANRQMTQENLQAVLTLVDWDEPAKSPLLQISLQPHGGLPTPVFATPQHPQYRELVRWVVWVTGGQGSLGPDSEPIPPPMPPTGPDQAGEFPLESTPAAPSPAASPPLGPDLVSPSSGASLRRGPNDTPPVLPHTVLPGTSQAGPSANFSTAPASLPAGPNDGEIPRRSAAVLPLPADTRTTASSPASPRLPEARNFSVQQGSPQETTTENSPLHPEAEMTAAAHLPPNRVIWASSQPTRSHTAPVVSAATGELTAEQASGSPNQDPGPRESPTPLGGKTVHRSPSGLADDPPSSHQDSPGSSESSKAAPRFFLPWKLRLGELLRKYNP